MNDQFDRLSRTADDTVDAVTDRLKAPKKLFGMTYPVWYFIGVVVAIVAILALVSNTAGG